MTGDARDLARDPGTLGVVDTLVATRPGRLLAPLELISLERGDPEGQRREAERTVKDGWERRPFPRVRLEFPLRWDEVCAAERSWSFYLHAWDPISAVLREHGSGGDDRLLEFCLEFALDWVAQYPKPTSPSPFAWYDMA